MAEFNINYSTVGQVNENGDNYAVTGNTGPVAVTQEGGQTVQTTGNENQVKVEAKPSFWAVLWKKVKGWFAGLVGLFTKGKP